MAGHYDHRIYFVPATKNTSYKKLIIFYKVPVLSKESLWINLYIPKSLLGNNSVKMFPRERRIVGGVVFYAVRVLSRESSWLIVPRIICEGGGQPDEIAYFLPIASNIKRSLAEFKKHTGTAANLQHIFGSWNYVVNTKMFYSFPFCFLIIA
jgi:hypothetical protein